MTGSIPFLLEKTESFEKTFRKLGKSKAYDKTFPEKIGTHTQRTLAKNPYPVRQNYQTDGHFIN